MTGEKNGIRNGFTLIEAAMSIMILGIMLAGAANLYDRSRQQDSVKVTQVRMQAIVKALSSYVETANRLPCPADPSVNDATFGWEWGVTAAALAASSTSKPVGACGNVSAAQPGNDTTGIVPYQTLGLPYEDSMDGWGRYFTYAVSPAFTQSTDTSCAAISGTATSPCPSPGTCATACDPAAACQTCINNYEKNFSVHVSCRTKAWVDATGAAMDNINTPKTRFCCAADNLDASKPGFDWPAATYLKIQSWTNPGTDISPTPDDFSAAPYNAYYAPINSLYVNTADPAGDQRPLPADPFSTDPTPPYAGNIVAPAFVLISHGLNGDGAYLANGTFAKYASGGPVGAGETENQNLDRTYDTGPTSTGTFDDIVVWMTQDGIMAYNGTSSCQYP